MNVRFANPGDARAIAEIHVHAWQQGYRDALPEALLRKLSLREHERHFAWRLAHNDLRFLVAVDAGRVEGWLAFGPRGPLALESDFAPPDAEIHGLYVAPDVFRRGVGSALLQRTEALLADQRYEGVLIWVLERNARGRAFYEARGFTLARPRKNFEQDGARFPLVCYTKAVCRDTLTGASSASR
jgi:ribosomal protein S18 acetylase RimI-like enzyme